MKRLLAYQFLVLVLTFSLQSWTNADDIRDFQIEGMSIGDNALEFFSKEEIKKNVQNYHKKKDLVPVWIRSSKFISYEGIQFYYKKLENKYIIVGIEGIIPYLESMGAKIEDCYKKVDEIDNEILNSFTNTKRIDEGIVNHPKDKTGKTKIREILYIFSNDDIAYVKCFDWSEEMGFGDHLRVGFKTDELNLWYDTAN
tara:strand:- start:813 stop:1406 length:594 start_codon:yes stop_codon:yes gene_type:complete